ncbi:MAG: hypothetical protein HY300_05865 [Verrucomicrobia bacterium]|nr:hypothetical protein [Verrucomicrobiota bacterium]
MNNANDKWTKLARTARLAPPEAEKQIPFGFATRVASRWASGEIAAAAPWEKLALRTLAFAAVLMVASVTLNFDFLTGDWSQEIASADPVFGNLLDQ